MFFNSSLLFHIFNNDTLVTNGVPQNSTQDCLQQSSTGETVLKSLAYFIIIVLVPICILTNLYGATAWTLKAESKKMQKESWNHQTRLSEQSKKVVRSSVIIITAFGLCMITQLVSVFIRVRVELERTTHLCISHCGSIHCNFYVKCITHSLTAHCTHWHVGQHVKCMECVKSLFLFYFH